MAMVEKWVAYPIDFTELKRLAGKLRKNKEVKDLANGVLSLTQELLYLHGCVKRGRGIDIDPDHPGRNVFEYIKELECKINTLGL